MTINEQRTTNDIDAVLFDMDGTLIDESASYREATRLTAEFLLAEPVSWEEVEEVKRIPGFNKDWDATWALMQWRVQGSIRPLDDADRESPAYRCLVNVFQTYYLGHQLWADASGMKPPFEWSEPLMSRETPLVTIDTLERLSPLALGIATSRPRMEALMAVREHDLTRFFPDDLIVADTDAPFEKPHPAPLLELVKRLGCRRPVYVGDTINDAIAAAAAAMPYIHVGAEPLADPTVPVHRRLTSVQELPSLLIGSIAPAGSDGR